MKIIDLPLPRKKRHATGKKQKRQPTKVTAPLVGEGGRGTGGRGRVLPKILGGGVPHGSQNPDPISDQNISFSIPFFRPLEAAFNRVI